MTRKKSLVLIGAIALILCMLAFGVFAGVGTRTAYAEMSGSGTASDPYLIGTKAELEMFRDIVIGANGQTRNVSACARLTADIDLEGNEDDQWNPIGNSSWANNGYSTFEGIFDGAGHTISGLYINKPTKSCQGLFGEARNATIKKVTVQGSVTGSSRLGGIVGSMGNSYGGNCTIYKCVNECTIYSAYEGNASDVPSNQVGGIVGYATGKGHVISSCVNKGNVSTVVRVTPYQSGSSSYTYHHANAAGILGFSINCSTVIKNCVNEGNISSATGVAGIVAYLTGEGCAITGCFNKGEITSNPTWSGTTPDDCKCGGIAGIAYADITHCGNEGNIRAHGFGVGGIVSFIYGAEYEISYCYNTGNITGATSSTGGITPTNSNVPITNCYNTGDITIATTSSGFGGIVASASGPISYVFNYGRLIENASYTYKARGSIAGNGYSGTTIDHAYYLNGSCGRGIGWNDYNQTGPAAGCSSTSLTAAQMLNQSSFAGWDFENVWFMDNDAGHPVLRHVHDYCCEADEETDTITVACERPYGDVKTYCDNLGITYTLKLYAPTMARERDGGNAAATLDADELAAFNAGTGLDVNYNNVTYARREGGNVTELGTDAPATFGDYTVKLTVSGEFVSINYTIEKLVIEFEKEVFLNGETSTTTVTNLNGETAAAILSDEEIERTVNGESVSIYIEVTTENDLLDIPAEDKTEARTLVKESGTKEGAYLDLSLYKKVGEADPEAVHDSASVFDITVDIPAELAEPYGHTRTYSIIRVHDGEAVVLPSVVENGKISFSTDKFSTYLIAYSDEFDENGEYIEFTTGFVGDSTRYIDNTNIGDTVTVTYKITHNDGFNSILLIPQYDKNVFGIQSFTVNEVALGEATATQGSGTKKIVLENTGEKYVALDGENEFFLTVTYSILTPTEGEYEFGLVLSSAEENGASVAYYIMDGENKGEQSRVGIKVVQPEAFTLIVKKDATIEIGQNQISACDVFDTVYDYVFTYAKEAVSVEKVDELPEYDEPVNDLKVYYTYNGDATVSYTWYMIDTEGNLTITVKGRQYTVSETSAPMLAGEYVVALSAGATDAYYAADTKYGYVRIVEKNVVVTIADSSSEYGDAIAELTYTTDVAPFEGDNYHIALTTTATSDSAVGTYRIIGGFDPEYMTENIGKYTFRFEGNWHESPNVDGTYTITKKTLTITALDQSAEYTGSEPAVDQTKYTVSIEGLVISGVTITKAAGTGVGTYELSVAYVNDNYDLVFVPGTFTIESAGADVDAIKAYFSALEKVYNGEDQDLLSVDTLPGYVTGYTAQNNEQKNVGTYTVTVTVTADENHNFGGENSCVFTVEGAKITPAPVTLTANDVSVYYGYGEQPVTPSFTVEGTSEEIDYTYVITADEEAFVPDSTTPVGSYPIVVTAGNNPNFTVTTVNGTYAVNKANATVSVNAGDVYYNRALNVTSSASVNALSLTAQVKFYSDSEYQTEVTPAGAGVYYVKATVAGTENYNAAEATDTFEIKKVKLEGVEFSYDHGNVTWTAVANDLGKTADEEGVEGAALKEGVTVTYKVYDGDQEIGTFNDRSFTATSATTYKVVVIASDDNYILNGESVMVAAYAVTFDEGVHAANEQGEVVNLPATQYIFSGQTAVEPVPAPTVEGCTFSNWALNGTTDYTFAEEVNSDIQLIAIWDAVKHTVTFKYLSASVTTSGEDQDVFTYQMTYGSYISYSTGTIAPVKSSSDSGIYYTFADKWTYNDGEYAVTTSGNTSTIVGLTVEGDMTFVAVFDTNYNSYTITYYFSENDSTSEYTQYGETQTVSYGAAITYRAFEGDEIPWFVADYWYGNEARTAGLYNNMPAEDISVYGTYKFDIGKGDVNASGTVTTDDITLYRQWIVGGYEMTVVEAGTEWALVTSDDYDSDVTYFVMRVADINEDESRDIRDVSITRMALVEGYNWEVMVGENVSGDNIVRIATVGTKMALTNALDVGFAGLFDDLATANSNIEVVKESGNIYLNLNGNTLTVRSLTFVVDSIGGKITVKNGTIVSANGISLRAPNGSVVIDDVTVYDGDGNIALQAANESLHFSGEVAFYNGEEGSSDPAAVKVAEGTRVVIEQGATLTVEKLVVSTVQNGVFTADETKSIVLENKTNNSVIVEGVTINAD